MTFDVSKKLGGIFSTETTADKIARLTEKMALGMQYESLMKSDHWPVLAALLESKRQQAVNELSVPELSESARLISNARCGLIVEIQMDIETEINRAQKCKNELDKIKENENAR
jgi:hypothetical protein